MPNATTYEYKHTCGTVVAVILLDEQEPWSVYQERMSDHRATCKAER